MKAKISGLVFKNLFSYLFCQCLFGVFAIIGLLAAVYYNGGKLPLSCWLKGRFWKNLHRLQVYSVIGRVVVVTTVIDWLLDGEAFVEYSTRLDLLGAIRK